MQAAWPNYMSQPPEIRVPRNDKFRLMTWVLYDIDAPNPYDRSESPYLHYMRANIACTSAAMSELCELGESHASEIEPFARPDPSQNIPHSYYIEVFGHNQPIHAEQERDFIQASGKANFDLPLFKRRNQLTTLYTGAFLADGKSRPTKER